MKLKEQKKFGAEYEVIKIDDKVLMTFLSAYFGKLFNLAELKAGKYQAEVIEMLKAWKHIGKRKVYSNLVPNLLRYSLATMISGTAVTPTFQANKVCLGDDNTAVDYTDEELGNETLRSDFGNRYSQFNVAYLDKYFGSAEVGGNSYYEAGVFVDGTAIADSGYLLSHVNIDETMTATESLTVNVTFTITDS